MQTVNVSNPNDFKVVTFHNSTDFGFTPEMGCMYDSRPINGKSGAPGIEAGETVTLPYHIGHQLAINLAKRVLNTSPAATVDAAGIPTGVAIWNPEKLEELKNSYLTELYTEAKPVAQTDTEKLLAKVEEYKQMVDTLINKETPEKVEEIIVATTSPEVITTVSTYADKQEVLAELEKRGIRHDKRKNKDDLEKLLV